jgi:hypothetical protein
MVNKKGIMRIIEASIAILIILVVILTISLTRRAATERDLSETITPLLEEIAKNNTLRDEIIANPENANESIMALLAARIREPNIGYNVAICEINNPCSLESYPGDVSGNVYVGSRLISSGLIGGAQSKRVAIFLWVRG